MIELVAFEEQFEALANANIIAILVEGSCFFTIGSMDGGISGRGIAKEMKPRKCLVCESRAPLTRQETLQSAEEPMSGRPFILRVGC